MLSIPDLPWIHEPSWFYDQGEDRWRAVATVMKERPFLSIGSLPCTKFSIKERARQGVDEEANWK